jgi:hypothetical protein
MSTDPAVSASMRRLLADAGAPGVSDELLTALGRVEENYVGVACMEARPEEGTVVECDVRPGESLEWLVFRRPVVRQPSCATCGGRADSRSARISCAWPTPARRHVPRARIAATCRC